MSRMEVKVLGIPLSQDYEKNERGTRKGGYVEQMLSFATASDTKQASTSTTDWSASTCRQDWP